MTIPRSAYKTDGHPNCDLLTEPTVSGVLSRLWLVSGRDVVTVRETASGICIHSFASLPTARPNSPFSPLSEMSPDPHPSLQNACCFQLTDARNGLEAQEHSSKWRLLHALQNLTVHLFDFFLKAS